MVPIHHISKPTQPDGKPALPSDALCYLVGCDGVFKQVRNEFYSVRLKVGGVGGLAEIGETAVLNVPKLPEKLLRQVESFFVAVYHEHDSEAVVLLLCNPVMKEWRVEIPPQQVQGLHVKYDTSKLPDPPAGFQRFGSIHSHASLKAFHSGTDDNDEAAFDGLHITIGNLDQPARSYSCRWMLAGKAFQAELTEVVEGPSLPAADAAWLAKVSKAEVVENTWGGLSSPWPQSELFPPETVSAYEPEDFGSPEEYREYLEQMRNEVDERLLEVRAAQHGKGR